MKVVRTAKEEVKLQFLEWAQGKSMDEIADKFYDAISKTYDSTREFMLQKTFEHFVAPVLKKK